MKLGEDCQPGPGFGESNTWWSIVSICKIQYNSRKGSLAMISPTSAIPGAQ